MAITDPIAPEEGRGPGRDVGAVLHAVRILQFLAGSPGPHGVASIARGARVSPSTCFNILRTLARTRLVAFDTRDKSYRLGLAVAELAAGLVGTGQAELIRPEIERLALNYQMLIALWRVTDDGHILLVDRAVGETAVRIEMRPGLRLPMLAGAVGRSVAAARGLSGTELRRRFAELRWENPPSFGDYEGEVRSARDRGWSIDRAQLYRGIVSVAAVATDGGGHPRFGFSGIAIAGQQADDTLTRLGGELRDVALLVGRALFSRPNSHPAGE